MAAQLRNRTMPPVENKLTEADRLHVAQWIESRLRETACNAGDYAGAGTIRRLNRREYHNTVRDLLGVDFDVSAVFPADGTGGAGFDTNGETLYVQPLLMERYVQAAQQILDRVIITSAGLPDFHSGGTQTGRTARRQRHQDAGPERGTVGDAAGLCWRRLRRPHLA